MRLIDADAFVKYLENEIRLMEEDGANPYAVMIASGAINDVGIQPTIEAVPKDFHDKTCEAMARRYTEEIQRLMPKQGEWELFYESKDGDNVYKCSCCGLITVIPEGIKLFSFCPNCGADMRGENNETDKEMR